MPTLQENMEPEDIEPTEKNLVPLPEDTLYEERPRLTLDQIREFAKQGSGKTLENLWESQEKKVIQSKAKVLQQERSYSKESYILQVITKSIISIQDHYGLDRLSEEENEAMINMAVYAAIKNLQTQKVFTQ